MRRFFQRLAFLQIACIMFAPAANAVRFGVPSDNPAFGETTMGSATLLCPRLAVTCIHCVDALKNAGGMVILTFPQAVDKTMYSDPDMQTLEVYRNAHLDIAAIGVKSGPGFQFKTPVQFPRLPGQNIALNSAADVYGIGVTGLYDKTSIRTGEVKVAEFNNDYIRVIPGRMQQIGCPNDSGGPLIQDNILYGTLSEGSIQGDSSNDSESNCLHTIRNTYVKIGEANGVRDWLQGLMNIYCTSETRN